MLEGHEIPTQVYGDPVEWVFRVNPPSFPRGYPGDGSLEKTCAFLLSVEGEGEEDQRFWMTCFGVTGKLMAGDMYFALEDAMTFPTQEFGLPSSEWARLTR